MTITTTPPQITCPEWCTVTTREHTDDLEGFEGFVIHRGSRRRVSWAVSQFAATGALDPLDPPLITMDEPPEGVNATEAEQLIEDLRHAVEVVRAEIGA